MGMHYDLKPTEAMVLDEEMHKTVSRLSIHICVYESKVSMKLT